MITFGQLCDNDKWGRLGNNMFAIAAVVGTANKHNQSWMIPQWKWAKYFNGVFNQGEIQSLIFHKEPGFHYDEIRCRGDLDLRGFYQSRRYWEHCEDEIRKLFAPSEQVVNWVKTWGLDKEAIGVHIRRGDYVTTMKHYYWDLSETEYYKQALEVFKGPVLVISDDIDWCKKNFKADYYGNGNPVEDMFLFASCPRKIMANSSLSWWGSYLGGGEVIAPKQWFKPIAKHDTKDLYLKEWKIL